MQARSHAADLAHLHLTGWPFQTVPDETFARLWADRLTVKEQVDRLMWRWSRQNRSYLNVMWADLGAGKSHTLLHIRQHCLDQPALGILPVYAVMPKEIHSFLDVYQAIMARLDLDAFADMFAGVYRSAGGKKAISSDVFPFIPDTSSVLRKMQSDSETTRRLAAAWLMGTRGLTRGQLNTLEASRSIKTTDDCVAILRGLIRLVQVTGKYRRVLIMLDECQRMWGFKAAVGLNINIGLQTWYDSSPNHLALLLSFKCGDEEHVRRLISEDLQSREDYLRISLPLLTKVDALNFIGYLLDHFRSPESPSRWFPFTEGVVGAVVGHLTMRGGVTPRLLMKGFEALLSEADFQIASGGQFELGTREAIHLVETALRQVRDEEE